MISPSNSPIYLLEEFQFTDSTGEKMVYISVAVAIFRSKIPVNQCRVCRWLNIGVYPAAIPSVNGWHILTNAHDLTCSDRRVRPAGMFFVLLEVVAKHAQRFFEGVRANRVNARSYLSKLVKIKNQNLSFLGGGCGVQSTTPLYSSEHLGCSLSRIGLQRRFPIVQFWAVLFTKPVPANTYTLPPPAYCIVLIA